MFFLVGTVVVLGTASAYLIPSGEKRADPRNAASVALGEQKYGEYCASCHGVQLEGEPNWRSPNEDGSLPAPPHDESGHTWHHGDDLLFRYIKKGGAYVAPEGFVSGMPGFEAMLSDAEIRDILAFIKSKWPEEIRNAQAVR